MCFVLVQQNCTLCCMQCHLPYFEWVEVLLTGYFLTSHSLFYKLLASDQMSLLLPVRNYWHLLFFMLLLSFWCFSIL